MPDSCDAYYIISGTSARLNSYAIIFVIVRFLTLSLYHFLQCLLTNVIASPLLSSVRACDSTQLFPSERASSSYDVILSVRACLVCFLRHSFRQSIPHVLFTSLFLSVRTPMSFGRHYFRQSVPHVLMTPFFQSERASCASYVILPVRAHLMWSYVIVSVTCLTHLSIDWKLFKAKHAPMRLAFTMLISKVLGEGIMFNFQNEDETQFNHGVTRTKQN